MSIDAYLIIIVCGLLIVSWFIYYLTSNKKTTGSTATAADKTTTATTATTTTGTTAVSKPSPPPMQLTSVTPTKLVSQVAQVLPLSREELDRLSKSLGPHRFPSEIIPGLWLGSRASLAHLLDITRGGTIPLKILNVTPTEDIITKEQLAHLKNVEKLQIPIEDIPATNIIQYFDTTNNFIREGLENDKIVLVHCEAGISRSATLVAAYMMQWMVKQSKSVERDQVLEFIRAKRAIILPNPGFMDQLKIYQNLLLSKQGS